MRQAFQQIERRGDALANDGRVPEPVKNVWAVGKNVVRQAVDATSFGGATANGAPRKTQ